MRDRGDGEAETAFDAVFTGFVIDTNNTTHDVIESDDWKVSDSCKELADVLGVEFVDGSYGTH